jgi:hypothetical protein
MAVALAEMIKVVRPAMASRVKLSRPMLSVPSQCDPLGPANGELLIANGSWNLATVTSTEAATMTIMMITPIRSSTAQRLGCSACRSAGRWASAIASEASTVMPASPP